MGWFCCVCVVCGWVIGIFFIVCWGCVCRLNMCDRLCYFCVWMCLFLVGWVNMWLCWCCMWLWIVWWVLVVDLCLLCDWFVCSCIWCCLCVVVFWWMICWSWSWNCCWLMMFMGMFILFVVGMWVVLWVVCVIWLWVLCCGVLDVWWSCWSCWWVLSMMGSWFCSWGWIWSDRLVVVNGCEIGCWVLFVLFWYWIGKFCWCVFMVVFGVVVWVCCFVVLVFFLCWVVCGVWLVICCGFWWDGLLLWVFFFDGYLGMVYGVVCVVLD